MLAVLERTRIATAAFAIVGCAQSAPSPPANNPRTATPQPAITPQDGDGDSVVDDDCPDERETFNGLLDEDGCPDRSHSYLISTTGLTAPRTAPTAARPTNCPVFRRVHSPEGQIERWFLATPPTGESPSLVTELPSLVPIIDERAADVEVIGVAAENEDLDIATQRAKRVASTLRSEVTRTSGVRVGRAEPGARNGVVFRIVDRSRVTVTYVCYDRDPP